MTEAVTPTEITFEEAFSKLEEILEKMNSNTVSLDDSLCLYKEADQLINLCSKRLNHAEREVEMLIKNRQGEVLLGPDQKPQTQPYTATFLTPPK